VVDILKLALTLLVTFLAFWPKRKVDVVYSTYRMEGVMHRIIAVRELPPRDVLRIFVSGEFLNGMWSFVPWASMLITWVKKNKLRFICCPSLTLILVVSPRSICAGVNDMGELDLYADVLAS